MTYISGQKFKVSVVIPIFNELGNIRPLAQRLTSILVEYGDYEIIFVDDGSTDETAAELRTLGSEDYHIQFLRFSRNFGQQAALMAGLAKALGEVTITMDGDLQHPPEFIPAMIAKWQEGYDVVLTVRATQNSSFLKRSTSRLFYSLLNAISDTKILPGAADFRLLDRQVVDAIGHFREKNLFLRGLIAWLGFKQIAISYNESPRHKGVSQYSIRKMIGLAWDGVTSFSIRPLRLALLLGLSILILASLYGAYILAIILWRPEMVVPGWASVIVAILLMGGVQLVTLGIMGEYLGKLVLECKRRPNWIVSEESNSASHKSEDRNVG